MLKIRQAMNYIGWLYSMGRLRRAWVRVGFSERLALMAEVRPWVIPMPPADHKMRIDHPDALMMIKPSDVTRAIARIKGGLRHDLFKTVGNGFEMQAHEPDKDGKY